MGSVLDHGINLEALKERQARIRAKMQLDGEQSPPPEIDSAEKTLNHRSNNPSINKIQRRQEDLTQQAEENLGHAYSFKQLAS